MRDTLVQVWCTVIDNPEASEKNKYLTDKKNLRQTVEYIE